MKFLPTSLAFFIIIRILINKHFKDNNNISYNCYERRVKK